MTMLKGKHIIHDEDETYRTGQIVDADQQYALIREDFMKDLEGPSYMMRLVSLDEIANSFVDNGARPEWQIFNSKEELDAYINWFETPIEEPKIVPFTKGH
jgi:hypothetical protein